MESAANYRLEACPSFHAAFDVDITTNVGFHERELGRWQQHPTQRCWSIEHQRETRMRILAAIGRAIPELYVEGSLTRRSEQRGKNLAATANCAVVDTNGGVLELVGGRHQSLERGTLTGVSSSRHMYHDPTLRYGAHLAPIFFTRSGFGNFLSRYAFCIPF